MSRLGDIEFNHLPGRLCQVLVVGGILMPRPFPWRGGAADRDAIKGRRRKDGTQLGDVGVSFISWRPGAASG